MGESVEVLCSGGRVLAHCHAGESRGFPTQISRLSQQGITKLRLLFVNICIKRCIFRGTLVYAGRIIPLTANPRGLLRKASFRSICFGGHCDLGRRDVR